MSKNNKLKIAVIGAGMSGLLTAIKLREAGYCEFRVFEKASRVGGTWRDNTYPGLTCDVPSQHYCYSFEKNPEWSHLFSPGAEIAAYFENVARKYQLEDSIVFDHELVAAKWCDGRWHLEFANGARETFDIVISATGVLHHPVFPNISGRDVFDGASFHTARWRHDVDLTGKKVGIIGTGSTAIQIVPSIINTVESLSLFQRSAQWILPIPNPPYSDEQKAEYRAQPERLDFAYDQFAERIRTTIARAVIGDTEQMEKIAEACRRNLTDNVTDPALRAELTPDYAVACKRLIMSEQFYPAIQRHNANLITVPIDAIETNGVRTRDARLHDLDVLVYATGFDAHRFIRGMQITGDNGQSIDDVWCEATTAHRSMTVPGFPNFFMMVGPNSPIGNFSLIMVAEQQIQHILKLIEPIRQGRCTSLQPSGDACATFNEKVRAAMGNTVWVSGCSSWYLDQNGNPILWPWTLERFVEDMHEPIFDEYVLSS